MNIEQISVLKIGFIVSRTNKGIALLDAEHGIIFTAWHNDYMIEVGRAPGKFTKLQRLEVYSKVVEIYHLQKKLKAEETFERKTSPWVERVRARAARIRKASKELRTLVMQSAPIELIRAAKLRVKEAQAT